MIIFYVLIGHMYLQNYIIYVNYEFYCTAIQRLQFPPWHVLTITRYAKPQ